MFIFCIYIWYCFVPKQSHQSLDLGDLGKKGTSCGLGPRPTSKGINLVGSGVASMVREHHAEKAKLLFVYSFYSGLFRFWGAHSISLCMVPFSIFLYKHHLLATFRRVHHYFTILYLLSSHCTWCFPCHGKIHGIFHHFVWILWKTHGKAMDFPCQKKPPAGTLTTSPHLQHSL